MNLPQLVLGLVLLVVLALWVMRIRLARATDKAMNALANAGAFTVETARTRDELGMQKRPYWWRMGLRDYQDIALRALVQSGIIKMDDDRFYVLKEIYESYRAKKEGRK